MLPSLVSLFKLTVEVSTINLKAAKTLVSPWICTCSNSLHRRRHMRSSPTRRIGRRIRTRRLVSQSGMDDGDPSTVNEEKQRCSLP